MFGIWVSSTTLLPSFPPRHTPSADLGCLGENMAAYKLMKTERIWAIIEKRMNKGWRRLQQHMEGLK